MKTVLEYLQERKNIALHNLFCYSKTYSMDTPKNGYEKEFAGAVRDCEIVEELIALVEAKETPIKQTSLNEERLSVYVKQQKRQFQETKAQLNRLHTPSEQLALQQQTPQAHRSEHQ